MRIILTVATLLFCLAVASSKDALDKELIEMINNSQDSWVAGINPNFVGESVEGVKLLLGWKQSGVKPDVIKSYPQTSVPDTFDSRTTWPNCSSIGAIQNQARCGSCWAFGCVEAVTDRFCIHSNMTMDVQLSFQDENSCDNLDDGCQGGEPNTAWQYVKDTGIVTAACSPYTVPTCPPEKQPCLNFVNTPPCKKTCTNGQTWSNDLHFVKSFYGLSSSVSDIQTEIMTNGPVEACFTVYADFVTYKSGVYIHTHGSALGGHCVKLIGWGTLDNLPYWLVCNSWTTTWGDQGFFMIVRGRNECGIESDVYAGMPDYSRN